MNKEHWTERYRFIIIAIMLLFIWIGFMTFLYLKADEITRDPCSICAERMGDEIFCTFGKLLVPSTRIYYPNGSVELKNYGS